MSYLQKYVFQKKQDINVKAFNMITNKDEAKARAEHISCDCKCKFNSTTCNSNQKWNNSTCQRKFKNYLKCKKDYSKKVRDCHILHKLLLVIILLLIIVIICFYAIQKGAI